MRKILIVIVVVVSGAILYAASLYTKKHKQAIGKAAATLTALELFQAFEINESQANDMYLDKILEVSGTISGVIRNQDGVQVIMLQTENPMFGVSVTMAQENKAIQSGEQIRLKGICRGYLSDVVLTDGLTVE